MKFLDRNNVQVPHFFELKKKKKETVNWEQWVTTHKDKEYRELVVTLDQMQKGECAYCGQKLEPTKRHVEHFQPRSLHRDKTFEWSNLFLCCLNNRNEYCACFKDRQDNQYRILPIIKPDEQDPKQYLTFAKAKVDIKKDCPDAELAKNTINRLYLNHPTLVGKRMGALQCLNGYLADLDQRLSKMNPLLTKEDIKEDIEAIQKEVIGICGYSSTIKDHIEEWRLSEPDK